MADTGNDSRKPGWYWVDNDVLLSYGARIGAHGIAVYSVLALHANNDRTSWPSIGRIAKIIGASKPTVRAALDKLIEAGLIVVSLRQMEGINLTNHYELLDIGSKGALPLVKELDQGSKGALPGVVKELDQGSKGALPEQDSSNKTHLTRQELPVPPAASTQDELQVSKPRKAPTIQEGGQQDMFGAVAEICQLDPKLKRGMIARAAKQLLEANYTPAQVRAFADWWNRNDWRGRRGDPPTTSALMDRIMVAMKEGSKPNGRTYTNGISAFGGNSQKYDDGIPDEWRGRETEYIDWLCTQAPPPAA